MAYAVSEQSPPQVSDEGSFEDENGDTIVIAFLQENFTDQPEHLDEWKSLIFNDAKAKKYLLKALKKLESDKKEKWQFLPDKSLLLKALTYRPPSEIKAIIVGNDPIPERSLATGLSFSFPKRPHPNAENHVLYEEMDSALETNESNCKCTGMAVVEMKKALQEAGIEQIGDLNYCYEHWARRGVLLLNAALTIEVDEDKHYKIWAPFMKRLILLILQSSTIPLLGMFWGKWAGELHDAVVKRYKQEYSYKLDLFQSYAHPTCQNPHNKEIAFLPNASKQFKINPQLFAPCQNEITPTLHDTAEDRTNRKRPLSPMSMSTDMIKKEKRMEE